MKQWASGVSLVAPEMPLPKNGALVDLLPLPNAIRVYVQVDLTCREMFAIPASQGFAGIHACHEQKGP